MHCLEGPNRLRMEMNLWEHKIKFTAHHTTPTHIHTHARTPITSLNFLFHQTGLVSGTLQMWFLSDSCITERKVFVKTEDWTSLIGQTCLNSRGPFTFPYRWRAVSVTLQGSLQTERPLSLRCLNVITSGISTIAWSRDRERSIQAKSFLFRRKEHETQVNERKLTFTKRFAFSVTKTFHTRSIIFQKKGVKRHICDGVPLWSKTGEKQHRKGSVALPLTARTSLSPCLTLIRLKQLAICTHISVPLKNALFPRDTISQLVRPEDALPANCRFASHFANFILKTLVAENRIQTKHKSKRTLQRKKLILSLSLFLSLSLSLCLSPVCGPLLSTSTRGTQHMIQRTGGWGPSDSRSFSLLW